MSRTPRERVLQRRVPSIVFIISERLSEVETKNKYGNMEADGEQFPGGGRRTGQSGNY